MMPLERHFDSGFQATGDAFKDAAETLLANEGEGAAFTNSHLPVNFLLRHAVELFLKSMIVTIHRALKLPTGEGAHTCDPKIKDAKNQWQPLTRIHSVKRLLDEFERLAIANRESMIRLDASTWEVPADLRTWIQIIEDFDGNSTFSRYPFSNSPADGIKSSFTQIEPEEVQQQLHNENSGSAGKFLLAVKNQNDEIVTVFGVRENPLADFREALTKASTALYGSAYGIHMELVEGIGRKIKQWRNERNAAIDGCTSSLGSMP